jgi:hypothetical protein
MVPKAIPLRRHARVGVVQNLDGVTIKDGDDEAREVGGVSRGRQ